MSFVLSDFLASQWNNPLAVRTSSSGNPKVIIYGFFFNQLWSEDFFATKWQVILAQRQSEASPWVKSN
ncbi:hypothetical protein D0T49_10325 [Paludibacter sp. 221]|uniref:hypothetical protein n=1 Tax=Paludibacter sp. 221 TaxID=2302939 RepID=UPI0013D08315|nr:hypothetical protein [Paludibacter sp. 221]NDV47441.1 hypothetical protein [Paludibacter sp. 221]